MNQLASRPLNTQYEDILRLVLETGTPKSDRTGTGTISRFGAQLRFDLANEGFPLITTKKVFMRGVAEELFWFLRGSSSARELQEKNVHIWDEWANEKGDLGPVYGVQWRKWPDYNGGFIDQVSQIVEGLKNNPDSRRHLVSAWNVAQLPQMALMPCHVLYQAYVADGKISLQVYQRSCDLFLGLPFNIASYALLTHMLAQQTGLKVGEIIWSGGDCHIYSNHLDQVRLQLSRPAFPFPTLDIKPAADIFSYTWDDIKIEDYQCHSAIKAPIAV